jgi:hypothetical protein
MLRGESSGNSADIFAVTPALARKLAGELSAMADLADQISESIPDPAEALALTARSHVSCRIPFADRDRPTRLQ